MEIFLADTITINIWKLQNIHLKTFTNCNSNVLFFSNSKTLPHCQHLVNAYLKCMLVTCDMSFQVESTTGSEVNQLADIIHNLSAFIL